MLLFPTYLLVYCPERMIAFGYVCGLGTNALGYIIMEELESMEKHGIIIERNLYFVQKPLSVSAWNEEIGRCDEFCHELIVSICFLFIRQHKTKRRSTFWIVFCPNFTTVRFDDFFTDRQS